MNSNLNEELKVKTTAFDNFVEQVNLDKKPHQRKGVAWMLEREINKCGPQGVRGGLVADEMGLGKTIQVIGVIVSNFCRRTLIVLPFALLEQWHDQIYKYTGHKSLIYHGNKKDISIQDLIKAPIVLTTYGHIKAEAGFNNELHCISWDRVVFDEAHHLRNIQTRIHSGSLKIRAPIRWLITGTPIQNRKSDFFALCSVMGYPKEFYMESDNILTIARWSLLKRTKQQVGIVLPKVNLQHIDVNWSNKHESCLAEDIHGLLSFASVRTERQTNAAIAALGSSVLPTLQRCRQSCVYPKLMTSSIKKLNEIGLLDDDEYDLNIATASSSKLDAVSDKIISRGKNGRAKLVFCHYRGEIDELYKRIKHAGMKVSCLDGRTSYTERSELLSNMSLDVIILQIMTGCEGLNLQHFKEIYFVSPHWNPAIEDQAIARCHRIGQTDEVDIFRFAMTGFGNKSCTLDTYASDLQISKRKIYNILDNDVIKDVKY
tara:strand:+ start:146 stop:1606 length:1461 start_codon:yes stop_codon:yes gene_type:complete